MRRADHRLAGHPELRFLIADRVEEAALHAAQQLAHTRCVVSLERIENGADRRARRLEY